jgi:hypothetical protein
MCFSLVAVVVLELLQELQHHFVVCFHVAIRIFLLFH